MIRILDACEIRLSELGGKDGISSFNAYSIHSGETCIANVVNHSHFEDDPTQVLLCELCGNTGCGSVGWVHVRRIGEDVIWIPPRKLPEKAPDFEWQKFPPAYAERGDLGIPVFPPDVHDELRRQLRWLPDRSTIRPIRVREALALLQAEAPLDLLGCPPDPARLHYDRILAVGDGELEQELATVNAFAQKHAECDRPMQPITADATFHPIEFYLDAPGFPAWSGFCHLPNGIGIILQATQSTGGLTRWVLAFED